MKTPRRIFDARSHECFAKLSGDYNPIHIDALAARRTPAGAPIVHGIHSLLWLLEVIASHDVGIPDPTTLRAKFGRPIYVGDEGTTEMMKVASEGVRARIVVGHTDAVVATIRSGGRRRDAAVQGEETIPTAIPARPTDLRLNEMDARRGCLLFPASIAEVKGMFPSAASRYGGERMAALVCSSGLVGMVVPGLHSLLAGLEISFSSDVGSRLGVLQFAVVSTDSRFGFVRIGIRGRGIHGVLETVIRPRPVQQPGMAMVRARVAHGEFRDSTAVIIGGSRGLGEVTAKLIAAGGGRVVITYAAGRADAEAVCKEINGSGAECRLAHYDVRRPAAGQLDGLGRDVPGQIYYFATPPILGRRAGLFDSRRFDEFNSFYVAGFQDLVQTCLARKPGGIKVFYPSSIYINTRPQDMTEYTMSKAAAEVLCEDMQSYMPNLCVLTRRLPRMLTDQTASVAQAETSDPIEVMLPIIREMHAR